MGKNKGKNKGNNNKSSQPVVPQKVMKPLEELTSEEREALKQQGESEKAALIKEGEDAKVRLIEEGERKRDDIIKKAERDAKKSVDEIQAEYKKEIYDDAVAEAEQAKNAILEEANKIKAEMQGLKEELEVKTKEIEESFAKLSSQEEQFTKDKALLESQKLSYKIDVCSEINAEIDKLKAELVACEEKRDELAKKLRNVERELEASNDDKDYYMQELQSTDARRQKLVELQREIEQLSALNRTLNQLYTECKEECARLNKQLIKYGEDPAKLMYERNQMEEENGKLRDQLALYPSLEELKYLRTVKEKYEETLNELTRLKQSKLEDEKKLEDLDIYINDLDNARRFIRILELQRAELQRELDRIEENYNNHQERVFAALSAIDEELPTANYGRVGKSLKDICENFRLYLASRPVNPLYYSKQSIRTFFAGLAASRILILQGMSGTGKSSLPKAFEEYMGAVTDRIEVQSSWKDRNDLLGFYNDFEKRYKETKFLEVLYRATRDYQNIHLIMLDEMNLSRVEYYFADFLSVLEEEKQENWKIHLISNDIRGTLPEYIQNGYLPIRDNTWFVGTANKDDSTFTITDKVYDRAIVLNFDERAEEFDSIRTPAVRMSNEEFRQILSDATQLSSELKKRIKAIVQELDEAMKTYFEITFGNRISKQIEMFVPAYIKCGGTCEEAIDIIFASKVLRKLQGLYDESTKNGLDTFLTDIKKKYPDKFGVSKSAIQKMIDRI